jgi:hypothetical protein
MSDLRVVAFLVRCTQSLLVCENIDTDAFTFDDMAECQSRLPALIERVRVEDEVNEGQLIMGRCRYLLLKPDTGSGSRREPRINLLPGHSNKLGSSGEQSAAGATLSQPFRLGLIPRRERS